MSGHENLSGGTDRMSPVLMVTSVSSKNNTMPHRPTDLQDEGAPDLKQKCAPAVGSVTEKWKNLEEKLEVKDLKEREIEMSSERQKYVAKELATNISSKKRGSSTIVVPIKPETKYEMVSLTTPVQPIPPAVVAPSPMPTAPSVDRKKDESERKSDEDSITSEITEMRTHEVANKTPEWSDDEEASGLPRSESRASRSSRVFRAMRQMLCCGVRLENPSEDNISSPRSGVFNSGI